MLPPLLGIAVALCWFFSLGPLVLSHAPADPDAAWRSRPLRGSLIAFTKLGLGLFSLVIIPAIVITAFNVLHGPVPKTDSITACLQMMAGLTVAFSVLFFIASHCPTSRHLLLSVGLLIALLPVLSMLVIFPRGLLFGLFSNTPILTTTFLVISVGLLNLSVRQFQRARTRQHLLSAPIFAVIVLAIGIGVSPQGKIEVSPGDAKARLHSAAKSADGNTLTTTIAFDELDPDHVWQLNTWSARPSFPNRTFGDLPKFNLINSPTLHRQLGLEGFELFGALPAPAPLQFTRRKPSSTPTVMGIDQQEFLFQFQRLGLARLGLMPLRVGGKIALTTSSAVELVAPNSLASSIRVVIRFNPDAWTQQLDRSPEERLPLLVVIDESQHRALIFDHNPSAWQFTPTADAVELRLDLTLPKVFDAVSDLRLQLMQVKLSGVMHLFQSLALDP